MFQNIKLVYLLIVVMGILVMSCNSDVDLIKGDTTKLFTKVTSSHSGLHFVNEVNQTRENNHMINPEFISGAGVAIGDINNDGLPDLFFTGNQSRDRLYLNEGDLKFRDITESAGISNDEIWSAGVTFVDIDQDGDQDIYVCRNVYLEDEKSANQLYINNGDLTFTEKGSEFGLADRGFSVQAIFFDYNKDNLLDMYLVNQPPSLPGQGGQLNKSMAANPLFSDKLFKNVGGKFEDVSDEGQVRNFAFGLSCSVGDVNNDSWPDIYVTNDFDVADHLYINQRDGTFSNEILRSTKHISNFSMGSDIADYDNDGQLDIVVLDMMPEDHKRIKTHMGAMKPADFWNLVDRGEHYQYMFNTLQRNNGDGTFSDLAQLAGVASTDWSWAPLFADYDHDGFKDLFVTNGVKSNNRLSDLTSVYDEKVATLSKKAQSEGRNPQSAIDVMDFIDLAPTDKLANYIYKNNGDLTFSKKTEEWGLSDLTLSNGAAYADLDLDGDLELVVSNIDDEVGLYRNNTMENKAGNFIRFNIIDDGKEQFYGTRVSLFRSNTLWQMNEISNGRGYMSKSEDIVHFGIDQDSIVEKVEITWLDGTSLTLSNLKVNKVHDIKKPRQTAKAVKPQYADHTIFKEIGSALSLDKIVHEENNFDDYQKEVLLPHKMSQFGPSVGVGDMNNDGREDFFIGGSAGNPGKLLVQKSSGEFEEVSGGPWVVDRASEDMGVTFLDYDQDEDLDIFVVSGGNEFEPDDPLLQDRLYENKGNGIFEKIITAVPSYLTSGSCSLQCDYDGDGDMDLFVGGRLMPGHYPQPASSHLLENRGGKFMDVSKEKAPELNDLGLVTDAKWVDLNDDQLMDLAIVGEWMPITFFIQNDDGSFEKQIPKSLEKSSGWYYSIEAEDIDNDGDMDLVVGNLGLNYKYKASTNEPFEVHSHDFDNNGSLDIVLSYYEHGEAFPVRGKECSTQQIPTIADDFPTYKEFGESNLKGIYGADLSDAYNLKAHTFASSYVENLGNGEFKLRPLPSLAQVSAINNIIIKDFDNDGHADLLTSGNLFSAEIETPRNDASSGLFLRGDGSGNFLPTSIQSCGFNAPYEARDMKLIEGKNQDLILVANNSERLQVFGVFPPEI